MQTINVETADGRSLRCPEGTVVGSLLPDDASQASPPYIAALVNNDLASLSYPLTVNASVRFLTMADPHGWRIYRRSLCFLLAKVVHETFPEAQFSVEHSFGLGLYCSFHHPDRPDVDMPLETLERIETRMRELVAAGLPIQRRKIAYADAVSAFQASGQTDKLNLLRYRNPPRIVLHWCDGFSDLAHGPLAPSTDTLTHFKLLHYPPGFVLHMPDREHPGQVPAFEDQPHLFAIYQEHKEWGRILGVTTVGTLNRIIANREFDTFVRTAEALHEKKLARIADAVSERPECRFVLVAGPSSAGKTTFAHRLATHLRVNGLRPITLSTDNYFFGPAGTPLDENGKPDYEHIEAVDLNLFNEHLLKLMNGETLDLPEYNFETKQREYRGRRVTMAADQVVIIEGIHGLNPRLTQLVPPASKFRVYVSALTQLGVDSNNRISTTDNRLMRRIVRDHAYRGHSALDTLRLWSSVRRGEKRWIFPFQREADATFNSALDYELAVLKPFVEPLLMDVKPTDPEYAEARRLSEFLLNFHPGDAHAVPESSILREYIGNSVFRAQ